MNKVEDREPPIYAKIATQKRFSNEMKKTEIGWIPKDWEVMKLGKIADVGSGGTPNRQTKSYWNGNIAWITTTLIDFNTILAADEFITKEGLDNSAAKIYKSGTLLMAMYGQGKTRGKIAILGIQASINQACGAISLKNNVINKFLFYYLYKNYDYIRSLSNTGNQENLNGKIIKTIQIPLPPLPEQKAIAQVLSEMDETIASFDALIQKKQAVKQGAMQQLLTGKKRLEGFEGEWEVKELGEIVRITTGNKDTQDRENDGDYPFFVRSQTVERINSFSLLFSIVVF